MDFDLVFRAFCRAENPEVHSFDVNDDLRRTIKDRCDNHFDASVMSFLAIRPTDATHWAYLCLWAYACEQSNAWSNHVWSMSVLETMIHNGVRGMRPYYFRRSDVDPEEQRRMRDHEEWVTRVVTQLSNVEKTYSTYRLDIVADAVNAMKLTDEQAGVGHDEAHHMALGRNDSRADAINAAIDADVMTSEMIYRILMPDDDRSWRSRRNLLIAIVRRAVSEHNYLLFASVIRAMDWLYTTYGAVGHDVMGAVCDGIAFSDPDVATCYMMMSFVGIGYLRYDDTDIVDTAVDVLFEGAFISKCAPLIACCMETLHLIPKNRIARKIVSRIMSQMDMLHYMAPVFFTFDDLLVMAAYYCQPVLFVNVLEHKRNRALFPGYQPREKYALKLIGGYLAGLIRNVRAVERMHNIKFDAESITRAEDMLFARMNFPGVGVNLNALLLSVPHAHFRYKSRARPNRDESYGTLNPFLLHYVYDKGRLDNDAREPHVWGYASIHAELPTALAAYNATLDSLTHYDNGIRIHATRGDINLQFAPSELVRLYIGDVNLEHWRRLNREDSSSDMSLNDSSSEGDDGGDDNDGENDDGGNSPEQPEPVRARRELSLFDPDFMNAPNALIPDDEFSSGQSQESAPGSQSAADVSSPQQGVHSVHVVDAFARDDVPVRSPAIEASSSNRSVPGTPETPEYERVRRAQIRAGKQREIVNEKAKSPSPVATSSRSPQHIETSRKQSSLASADSSSSNSLASVQATLLEAQRNRPRDGPRFPPVEPPRGASHRDGPDHSFKLKIGSNRSLRGGLLPPTSTPPVIGSDDELEYSPPATPMLVSDLVNAAVSLQTMGGALQRVRQLDVRDPRFKEYAEDFLHHPADTPRSVFTKRAASAMAFLVFQRTQLMEPGPLPPEWPWS